MRLSRYFLPVLRETPKEAEIVSHQLMLRGTHKSFGAVLLPEGYALIVQLLPHCFRISPRALSEALREICGNAGLDQPFGGGAQWMRVQVNESEPPQRFAARQGLFGQGFRELVPVIGHRCCLSRIVRSCQLRCR